VPIVTELAASRIAPVATSAMTEDLGHMMEVMVVVVVRRGWLIGGSFDLIDMARVALPMGRVSDLARKWHDDDDDDGL
jgi:hypothetical protein